MRTSRRPATRISRYPRLSAEQAITPWPPASRVASIQAAIPCSHGQRSSSVHAVPECLFTTLLGGWNQSASAYAPPKRTANVAAIVLLPAPETPMTTIAHGSSSSASGAIVVLRCSFTIHQPNKVALGIGACSRQVRPCEQTAEDASFYHPVDEEKHFARRCQRRKRQGHTWNERFEAGFVDTDDPALLILELGTTGEERCRVPVRANSHQHDVEQWVPSGAP